jgi:hypothetical protein
MIIPALPAARRFAANLRMPPGRPYRTFSTFSHPRGPDFPNSRGKK